MSKLSLILDEFGNRYDLNGKPRMELAQAMIATMPPRRIAATYDSTRDTDEFKNHWANADSLDADSANSRTVRDKARNRSRYEAGSNGFYDGIINTHTNMLCGTGPSLRMLTGSREFNQLVEKEFSAWAKEVGLRRKLWSLAHARTQDGEAFALLQTNPILNSSVKLDIMPIEAEQCQSAYLSLSEPNYIDGIRCDDFGNVVWYDILPYHPGSTSAALFADPIQVSAPNVVHWFKLKRPGAHRGMPSMNSTLNCGAAARRWRESTQAAAESAADLNILLKTGLQPDSLDPVAPMSTQEIRKRMMTALPQGWDAMQMKSEFPTASHESFQRVLITEQARPISMPYNAAACDSSTYSFASGKLDTLCYRSELNVERGDCDDLVLDQIFKAWFREWTVIVERRDIPPAHQWDWPAHPVIDAVAEASAEDTKLKNGTKSLTKSYSDGGEDYEDGLVTMTTDYFGDPSEANIAKMREILLRTHYPAAASVLDKVSEVKQGEGTAPAEGDVQKTALNGAQVVGLLDIIGRAVAGEIPSESAGPILTAAFPGLSASQVSAITSPIKNFKAPEPKPVASPLIPKEPVLDEAQG